MIRLNTGQFHLMTICGLTLELVDGRLVASVVRFSLLDRKDVSSNLEVISIDRAAEFGLLLCLIAKLEVQ